MKRVIVLSDTHGLLRPEVLEYLSQADIIIHGGDINTQAIVDKLREYAPLYIVRGNNDKDWAEELPQSLTFTIEGVHFFLVHNKKDVLSDLSDTNVVIYGHSHKYACEERNGVLWLNPGSCGRRRFDQEITFAVMTVDGGHIQVEKVTIPHEKSNAIELGLTIPLQRHLHIKTLPYGQESNRRFCWDLHIIPLRGRPSLLAVHCYTRYTFVLYDLNRLDWKRLPAVFLDGLRRSLSAAGFSEETTEKLRGSELPLFTRTHGCREVAFLNRAWEDVIAAELALDESNQSQPLLEQIVNAKPSRCAGAEGLGMAAERLTDMLSQI